MELIDTHQFLVFLILSRLTLFLMYVRYIYDPFSPGLVNKVYILFEKWINLLPHSREVFKTCVGASTDLTITTGM